MEHFAAGYRDRLVGPKPSRYMFVAYLYIIESAGYFFIQHNRGLTRGNLSSYPSKLESAGYVVVEKRRTTKGRLTSERYRKSITHLLEQLPEQDGCS